MTTITTIKKPKNKEAENRIGFTFENYVVNTLTQIQGDIRRLDDKLDDKIEKVNDKIEKIHDKIDNRFMWMVGITLGTFATLVGLILSKH